MPGVPVPSAGLLRFLKCQIKSVSNVSQSQRWARSFCGSHTPPERPRSRRRHDGIVQRSLSNYSVSDARSLRALHRRRPLALQCTSREFSTTGALGWKWQHFWHKPQDERGDSTQGLPPLASFFDDSNQGLYRRLKAANEPRLRCTEFDDRGNVQLMNGEFKKSELIAKYGLMPRDLRKIDSSLLPSILVRDTAILVNLLHLRVLIKHNRVLVFDAYGSTDSYTQSVFMYDLEGKLRSPTQDLPYEFRALEAVLISVTSGLESEFEGVREPVVRVLRQLEEDIDRDKLRYLLIYSKKLGTFEQKARLVRDALEELLEEDGDLSAMYLTEKAHDLPREEDNHSEVELLLESYHKVSMEIVQAAENLVSNIRNTEEIVRAILDANRNSLMLLELRFSIWTLGLGAGTFIAALYGMNLKNFIEESDFGFWGVSITCTIASIVAVVIGIKKLRKVQRVSMWGSSGTDWNLWGGRDHSQRALPLPGLGGVPSGASGLGGMSALGPGAGTAGLGPVGGRAKHDYWLRKRQEHIKDRQQIVAQKLAKERARTSASTNASKTATPAKRDDDESPNGGYC